MGIGGSQKVDLRSPRPALICVPRGSGIAFRRSGTGERTPPGRAHVYNAGRAGIAGPPKRNLSQFVHSRAGCHGQSSGWPISLDKIGNRPRATMCGLTWLTRHICGRKAGGVCSPLMRRGVFSVSFALWGAPREEFLDMCDYSLHSVRTRPAKVGEKLVTHNFGTGTRGFAAPQDCSVAVCVLPGTELAF